MIIDCIADLHGHEPEVGCGDLLLVAGDLTAWDRDSQHIRFIKWLEELQSSADRYKKVVYIGGNHDNFLYARGRYGPIRTDPELAIEYLCDAGTVFENHLIWGCPWVPQFFGMSMMCRAFTTMELNCSYKFRKIPYETTILITHGPPRGVLDKNIQDEHCGSPSLGKIVPFLQNLKLHAFGHIHEQGGEIYTDAKGTKFCNCSIVDERYKKQRDKMRFKI